MSLLQTEGLYIADTEHKGRGVFCIHDIPKGSLVEIAPVLILSKAEKQLINLTLLYNYYFDWDETAENIAIALGYGRLYNHSKKANCETSCDYERQEIKIQSTELIKAGTELTINYAGTDPDMKNLWFKAL